MALPPNEPNPYEAPQTLEPTRIDLSDRPIDKHILEQFREQIRALCVVWFIVGVSVSVLAVVLAVPVTPSPASTTLPSAVALPEVMTGASLVPLMTMVTSR